MLTDIQSALRASISESARQVGPFLIHINDNDKHPFRNYAIPDDNAAPSTSDVAGLVAEFRKQRRMPRLEYVSPAPAVDAALTEAGFTVDLRLQLMTLAESELRHPGLPDGVEIRHALSDDELWQVARVQNIAYGGRAEVADADVHRLRATNDNGGAVLLALVVDEPAGAGLSVPPSHALAEIAAIGVLDKFRGRGIGAALGAELSQRLLTEGIQPYLQCETHNEKRIYGRIGYTTVGELLATSLSL